MERPPTYAELADLVRRQQTLLVELQESLTQAHEQIALLKKTLFGVKRERYVADRRQRSLFETVPVSPPPSAPTPPAPKRPPKRRRKFVIPDFLPVVREERALTPEELPCGGCGAERTVIQTHVSRRIELEPARAYVVEEVRCTYACARCRDGAQLVTTPKTPQPIDKSPFGASVLAWLICAKFERHLPTYRHQEMLDGPLGLWLSRPLICRLLCGAARCVRPLVEWMRVRILQSGVVQADETRFRYRDKTRGEPQGKSLLGQLFGYAGDVEHRRLYYDFRPDRSRAGPAEILANYKGILPADGYSAYETLVQESAGRLTLAACWMHARRKFDETQTTSSHALIDEAVRRAAVSDTNPNPETTRKPW